MRSINADALVQVQMYDEEHEEWSVETMTVEECLARFADVPTIIETDRPHGEWIVNIPNYKSVCSVCGANETDFIYGTEMWYGLGESKFCPSCGARMKGADDEDNH